MSERGGKMLKITLVKSPIGYNRRQKDTVKSLGLRRMSQSVLIGDAPQIRGMIAKVSHLVEVEEVEANETA
ncbi:MAG: 50S ribosomal protein L30 [Chloroflexi bacterium]|nr:50S ribosomal protein L30 [Chloroflexota bacterium]MCY3978813.1 50S ribosomal protein L30 [Chloroflexota bacterium]MDE2638667.1 50S ribosomal protein L30 [Chloroflexota bacterium]MYE27185.1 50S ribosomal protein L30 [Chloroflexota bacterium]